MKESLIHEKKKPSDPLLEQMKEAYHEHRIDEAEQLRRKLLSFHADLKEEDIKFLKKIESEYLKMIELYS